MQFKDYLEQSEKTLSKNDPIDLTAHQQKLLHGAIGLSTEANEILDQLKKHIYYGKELDIVNIKEELGDLFRYMAIFYRELGLDMEQTLHDNIEKLRKRYGEKFDAHKAIHRDTANELNHISS
ncbi:MAG TPA: nucleoside triphosphate pyrophosphohydrolase family protein [Candidatus Absconditabacterales bacterium]|nr:nucleoside triphosphate pyrophosphohydrolase family protein [Candidatus Absconditabacterales bacterium]HMT27162.1 nucleoside triphosphate pyrophosphohydrolase family protein [Candidatus Absconditabacterales bacterium]